MSFITKGIISLSLPLLAACSSVDKKSERLLGPHQRIYTAKFSKVWRAAQLTLTHSSSYPMRINDQDLGILETEQIRSIDGFVPPHIDRRTSGGLRYRISIKVVKGRTKFMEPAVKVIVFKDIKLYRSFFNDPESLESDGLEERSILYRIQRELDIDRATKKFSSGLQDDNPTHIVGRKY